MATLDIVIRAQNQASAALNQLQRQLGGIGREANVAQRGFGGLQRVVGGAVVAASAAAAAALVGVGAAITKISVDGVRMAADLEAQISSIAAVMGETKDAVEPLKDLILDLGLDPNLKVDAQEAADAIEMLARNGLKMDEILGGAARSTVLLANATGAQFGTAADIATDVMAQFNISAAEMNTAVNGITSVVTNSKFSIDDYGLAIAQAGGVASSVGVEFDDFNTTIAAISPLFASGSDAGTSFKTFLQRLEPDTKPAREAMAELGLLTEEGTSKFFDANGALRDMSEISVLLNGALAGLSEQQRNAALQAIFGTDAMRAAVGLMESGVVVYTDAAEAAAALGVSQEAVNAVIAGGVTQFEALQLTMGRTDAVEAAALRMDNLRGSMEILQGVIDTLKIRIGDVLLPIVRQMADAFTVFLTNNGDAIIAFFENLIVAVPKAAGLVRDLYDAMAWMLTGQGNNIDWWYDITDAISELSGGMLLTQEQADALAETLFSMAGKVSDMIAPITQAIGEFVSWQDVMVAIGIVVASIVIPALASIVTAAAPVIAAAAALVAGVALVRNAWEEDWGGIRTTTLSMIDGIVIGFGLLWDTMSTVAQAVGSAMATATDNIITSWDSVIAAMGVLSAAISTGWTGIQMLIAATVESIRMGISIDFQRIKNAVTNATDEAKNLVTAAWNAAKAILSGIWEGIRTAAVAAFSGVQSAMDAIVAAKDTVVAAFNALKDFIGGLSIPNPFGGIQSALAGIIDLANRAKGALASVGGGGGGSGGANAAGTPYFRGGLTTINERGTELLALPGRNRNVWLPRGTSIIPAERVPMMAGAGGGVTVNLYATVNNDMDAESIAWQVAAVLRRNQR